MQGKIKIDGVDYSFAENRTRIVGDTEWTWFYRYENGVPTTEHSVPTTFLKTGGRIVTGGHEFILTRAAMREMQ